MKQVSRLHKIVIVICICLLVQLGISWKVWLPFNRQFPLVNAFSFLNMHYGLIVDVILYALLAGSIIVLMVAPFKRQFIYLLGLLLTLLILEDINRFQPWVYMYALMLLSVGFGYKKWGEGKVLFMIRILLAATYLWSGLQKLNHAFAAEIFPWLMSPLGLTNFLETHHRLAYAIPFIETISGIVLLLKHYQKYAGIVLIAMHLLLLYILGPFGNTWNSLVWPWNLALAGILLLLIYEKDYAGFVVSVNPLFRSAWFITMGALTCIMPAFNFTGWWDNYLSDSFYSSNIPEAIFYSSKASNYADSVMGNITGAVYPQNGGKYYVIDAWALHELNTPVYPQDRYFKKIGAYLCNKTGDTNSGLIILKRKRFTSEKYEMNFKYDDLVKTAK